MLFRYNIKLSKVTISHHVVKVLGTSLPLVPASVVTVYRDREGKRSRPDPSVRPVRTYRGQIKYVLLYKNRPLYAFFLY